MQQCCARDGLTAFAPFHETITPSNVPVAILTGFLERGKTVISKRALDASRGTPLGAIATASTNRDPGETRVISPAENPFPHGYRAWVHCITVDCGIPITPAFVAARISILQQLGHDETRRFRHLHGDIHWRAVLGWFERAAREVRQPGKQGHR